MIPNVTTGRGITGAILYVLSEGNDPETHRRRPAVPFHESRAEIIGGQGFGFEVNSLQQLDVARRLMEWNARPDRQLGSATRTVEVDCFHMSLSWGKGERPDRAAMIWAAKSALSTLGMAEAQAVFVTHHDREQPHVHIVASRIDPESGRPYDTFKSQLKAQAWAIRYEKQFGITSAARRDVRDLVDAIDTRNVAGVLTYMTRRDSTFDAKALDRALTLGITDSDARHNFKLTVLADSQVIGLRTTADAKVTHYTTREVLRVENTVLEAAAKLTARHGYGVRAAKLAAVAKAETLSPEQTQALRHATQDNAFAMIIGEAGTGKSHTLGSIRKSYDGLSCRRHVVDQ